MKLRRPFDPKKLDPASRMATAVALLPWALVMGLSQLLTLEGGQREMVFAGGTIMGILTFFVSRSMFQEILPDPDDPKRIEDRARAVQERLADGSPPVPVVRRDSVSFQLGLLCRHDPAFSEVDLHAWLREVLPRLQEADEAQILGPLRPYVARPAWAALRRALGDTRHVEVAWVRLDEADHGAWDVLRFTVGVLATRAVGTEPVRLRCVLRRSTSARSLPLRDMCALGCPSCGGPVQVAPPEWACGFCGARIAEGQLHWRMVEVQPGPSDLRATWSPDAGGEHHSLRLPVALADDLEQALRELPDLDLPGLDRRIRTLMRDGVGLEAVQRFEDQAIAWSGGQRMPAPVNVLHVELARVGRDGQHARIDARVVLEGLHAILDHDGVVLDGNPEVPRQWAVYLRLACQIGPLAGNPRSTTVSQPWGGTPCPPEAWQPWSVLTPQEYLA